MPYDALKSDDIQEIESSERQRRDTLSRVTCALATLLIVLFALRDALIGNASIASTLALFASTNIIAMLLYSRYKSLELFGFYLLLSSSTLCFHLVAQGGTENSGIFWLATYPVLAFSIVPVRIGLIAIIIMLFAISLTLFIPDNPFYTAIYASHIKLASIGAYILVSSFTYYHANEREKSVISIAQLSRELSHIASTDELTHLPNRRDMALRLEFECRRAKRTGEHFSIILCDIDYFKKINDSFGHAVGDQALQAFSNLLDSRFRETDKVGRWGGEEFLVILPYTELDEAIELANNVRRDICQAVIFPNMPNRLVTMSAGVANSEQSFEPGELVNIADTNLYDAKNSGRNRVKPDPEMEPTQSQVNPI